MKKQGVNKVTLPANSVRAAVGFAEDLASNGFVRAAVRGKASFCLCGLVWSKE